MPMSVVYSHFGGRLVSESRNGVDRDYLHDPQGNTIGLIDENGELTDEWSYWPHGEVASRKGTTPTPFTWNGAHGYYTDPTGLTYVRARYYNAPNGQWQTADPMWPREQAYGYARQSPTNYVDPSGRHPIAIILLAAGGSCLVIGGLAYDYYAHKVFPYPDDDIGHCVASCLITTYMPWCVSGLAWGSECLPGGDPSWRDFIGNVAGIACGAALPFWTRYWFPKREADCIDCCKLALRTIPQGFSSLPPYGGSGSSGGGPWHGVQEHPGRISWPSI